MSKKSIMLILVLTVCTNMSAQRIAGLRFPSYLCANDTIYVTFGYEATDNVQIERIHASLGHSDRIFLPDGVLCPGIGCSYISSVNFQVFAPGNTVQSANDIKYLRINMEHSYGGDLYIRLNCPDGRTSDVLYFGGILSTPCADSIPLYARGWQDGDNALPDRFFGQPNGNEDSENMCDSTVRHNAAGIGWNYCWSNNEDIGYSYADNDGLIYRLGHNHQNTFDSSFVRAGWNFYHPDVSFDSLVGCPLNGEWSIEVIDGFAQDNGYLFGWELALKDSLMYNICQFDSFDVIGNGVTRIDDSTFMIIGPSDVNYVTYMLYTFRLYDECGGYKDTVAGMSIYPAFDTFVYEQVLENGLPHIYNDAVFDTDVVDYRFTYENWFGCDSTWHYTLKVWWNVEEFYDTAVCANEFPFRWRGVLFQHPDVSVRTLSTVHGADSTVTLRVTEKPVDTTHMHVTVCNGMPYTWIDGKTYTGEEVTPIYLFHTPGCDSLVQLHLHYPDKLFRAVATITPNPVQFGSMDVTMTDVSASSARLWTWLDRVDSARSTHFVYPLDADSVTVSMIAYDRNGCVDSLTDIIYLDRLAIWTPNAFTPDEQNNKYFSIQVNDVLRGEVQIYDRQGRHIVTFDLLYGSWDGTMKGEPCPQGTYVWHIKYVPLHQPQIEKEAIGTVTLLR